MKNQATIIYLADGELREEAIGTIDHLLRVTDGGDNNPANLVISCVVCHNERDRQTNIYNRPFARRRVPCAGCGGRFFHPDWVCCTICGATPRRAGSFIERLEHLVIAAKNLFTVFRLR